MTEVYEVEYEHDSILFIQRPGMEKPEPASVYELLAQPFGEPVNFSEWDGHGILTDENDQPFEDPDDAFELLKKQVYDVGASAITSLRRIA